MGTLINRSAKEAPMLPISSQQTRHTDIPAAESRRSSTSHGGTPRTHSVVNLGSTAAERYLFPTEQTAMTHVWMDASNYERSIARLEENERAALRTWSAVDTEPELNDRQYSDNTPTIEQSINYEINQTLSQGIPLNSEEAKFIASMDSALQKLPTTHGDALRVCEYSRNHPHPWGTKIKIGDIVTNFPLYMSASQTTDYAKQTLDGILTNPNHTDTMCIYKINMEIGAPPIFRGALTHSNENEILFPRDSCFRVDAISIAQPLSATDDLFKNRVAVVLTQVHRQEIAKNVYSGNPTYITTDVATLSLNYSLPHYQDTIRNSIISMHNLDKTMLPPVGSSSTKEATPAAPGVSAVADLKEVLLRAWNPEEIMELGQALRHSALTRDQIFQFLVSDDSNCNSSLFSALTALYPDAMAELRSTARKLGLTTEQIDYTLGCASMPHPKASTPSHAARILAELISVACIDPQRAAQLIKLENSDGEKVGNQIARLTEQGAATSLAGAYISLVKFLYEQKALDHLDAISILLPPKPHDKFKWLSHAITGAAWRSEPTSRLAALLVQLSKNNEIAASEIAFRLSLNQSGYSFKHTHLSLPADFYKLAKRAHQKNENMTALQLLHKGGLIPSNRELSKIAQTLTPTATPQFDESVGYLLATTLNKHIPEVILTEKVKNFEIKDMNRIKESTMAKLKEQATIDKEANQNAMTDATTSLLNLISQNENISRTNRSRKIDNYEQNVQRKKFKQASTSISEAHAPTAGPDIENQHLAASGEGHSSGISKHHSLPVSTPSSSIPSVEELEQWLNRVRMPDIPSERELSERFLRLREDRIPTQHIRKELAPPLKKD
ncbi:hypothetical protein [Burkholderia dolosa]|uniref:Uncharacterized protein n=2 Tax=Burkholderiaceae TaxID=119060 RepID=A0A892I0V4_9BURK|nr:hypothetical protein [Burkholderia dolosa]MBY4692196.1 hypothetical protein [Burkholderia dolosa]MBY4811773.1 hypothetical protein [Burkholderia dolosa]MBY4918420.1 hypothetical protein [Burkholderia dolosa]QRO76626.1 hypothetical protein I6K02_11985 [Burkholderia dolosa]